MQIAYKIGITLKNDYFNGEEVTFQNYRMDTTFWFQHLFCHLALFSNATNIQQQKKKLETDWFDYKNTMNFNVESEDHIKKPNALMNWGQKLVVFIIWSFVFAWLTLLWWMKMNPRQLKKDTKLNFKKNSF